MQRKKRWIVLRLLMAVMMVITMCGSAVWQSNTASAVGTSIKQIDGGYGFSLALMSDGTVSSWGLNEMGQLGNGTTSSPGTLPAKVVGLTDVTQITAGRSFSLALKSDGTLWWWGNDSAGVFNPYSPGAQPVPVQFQGLNGISSVSAGEDHVLALKSDGTIWAWGSNSYGQLGDGTYYERTSPVQVTSGTDTPLPKFVSIEAYGQESAAIDESGNLWFWGYRYPPAPESDPTRPAMIAGISQVKDVAISSVSFVALRSDGTVWSWGDNQYGALGYYSDYGSDTPTQIPGLADVVSISAGVKHVLALKSDGTVWTWGDNMYGQLGDGSQDAQHAYPTQVTGLTNATMAEAGRYHNIAVGTDGTVWSWGQGDHGEMGNGYVEFRNFAPQQTLGLGQVDVTAVPTASTVTLSYQSAVAATKYVVKRVLSPYDLSTLYQGPNTSYRDTGLTGNTTYSYLVEAYDANNASLGSKSLNVTTKDLNFQIQKLSAGTQHSVALKDDGSVWSWGNNGVGQLGVGTANNTSMAPVRAINLPMIRSVTAGNGFTLAIDDNGSVWAWGYSPYGQLGGTNTSASGYESTPFQVPGLSDVVAVAGGQNHSMALRADGTIWTWGLNDYGQLGNGTTTIQTRPAPVVFPAGVAVPKFKAIAAGVYHSLAVDENGHLWVWGLNNYGQLGDGTKVNRKNPYQLPSLSNVSKAAGGRWHSLALTTSGTVYAFGSNNGGQLGLPLTTTGVVTPNQVPNLSNVTGIDAGDYNSDLAYHSLVMKSDGTVWGFGSNSNGQLGNGTTTSSYLPVQVQKTTGTLSNAVAIAAGGKHSMALLGDGTIWGFGSNNSGQLGNGTVVDQKLAVQTMPMQQQGKLPVFDGPVPVDLPKDKEKEAKDKDDEKEKDK